MFAGLGMAAVAQLPPGRFATGSAAGTCARQVGAVLGISALRSWLAATDAGVGAFRTAWVAMTVAALPTAVCGVVVGAVRATRAVPVPVPAADPATVPVAAEETA